MIENGNKCSDDFLQVLPENRNITSKEFGERFIDALMATGQAVINQFLITLVCHHQCPLMVQVLSVWYGMVHSNAPLVQVRMDWYRLVGCCNNYRAHP